MGALVAAVGAVFIKVADRPALLHSLIRLDAEIAGDAPLAGGISGGGLIALSPDGSRLALSLRGVDGKVRLYTRPLDQNQINPLAGTENASIPFFSPDGEWIGFFADGKLKKVSIGGGAVVTLCDAPMPRGASWGDDGNIIAALRNGELSRIPSSGGTPIPVTKLKPGEVSHRWPQVLPGSQIVLFTAPSQSPANFEDSNIDVVTLKTGERKTVQHGGFSARFLATSNRTGHLVYLRQHTLFVVPFDPDRLALTGVPTPILEDVSASTGAGGEFAFGRSASGSGVFVYVAGKGQRNAPISGVDSAGKLQLLHAPSGNYSTPRFSPDGKRLAFSMDSGPAAADIWVKDTDGLTPTQRLTFLPGVNRDPVWAPDGKYIVFDSTNPAAPGMYWIVSDGSREAQRLTGRPIGRPYSFSPDGRLLAFTQPSQRELQDIIIAPIEGDPRREPSLRLGKPELFLENARRPAFSPDGHWLAYESEKSGPSDVYVRAFPGPGGQWQVSTGGGTFPRWSRAGHELLFETPDGRVMAAGYTANRDAFITGKPHVWSEIRLLDLGANSNYDLAPNGKILAAMLADDDAPTRVTFLLNFFDELRRRAPAK
jgi:serine/threonine-protein kinase